MKRTKAQLTPEKQSLVERHVWWLKYETRAANVEVAAEQGSIARLVLVECAAMFDPARSPGANQATIDTIFAAYSRLAIRRALARCRFQFHQRHRVWERMPRSRKGVGLDDRQRDTRRTETDPALALWCADDARAARRNVDIRGRVMLYLRAVEGWSAKEIGEYLGITRVRTGQLLTRVRHTIAETQLRDQIARQLKTA